MLLPHLEETSFMIRRNYIFEFRPIYDYRHSRTDVISGDADSPSRSDICRNYLRAGYPPQKN